MLFWNMCECVPACDCFVRLQAVDYEQIARVAARGHQQSFKDECINYMAFVRMWAGGKDGSHLRELDVFVKGLMFQRRVPSEFYKSLAALPLSSSPEYVIALVKAMVAAPDKFVSNQKA